MLLGLVACGDDPASAPTSSAVVASEAAPLAWAAPGKRADVLEIVTSWNDHIMAFDRLARVPPPVESRAAAMAHTTVHDVLNAVRRRYEGYAYTANVTQPVSVEAAVATGVRDVLVAVGAVPPFNPQAAAYIVQAAAASLAGIPDPISTVVAKILPARRRK